jgi:hypothetical protein
MLQALLYKLERTIGLAPRGTPHAAATRGTHTAFLARVHAAGCSNASAADQAQIGMGAAHA